MYGENIRVFLRIRSATCGVDTESQRCVRCIQRIGEDRIKFDCERCAKRQFSELMPSALAGAVFSPVSSPGNNSDCPNDIDERFDGVFSESSNCDEIYSSTFQSAVGLAVQGYNCSLIACGPVSTGKTFSLFGSKSASDTNFNPGIIAMVIRDLFRTIADESSQAEGPNSHSQIHVEMSCVELSGTQHCRNLLKGFGLVSHRPNNQSTSSMSVDDYSTVTGSVTSAMSSSPGFLKGKTGHVSVSDAETFDSPQVGVFLSGADLKVKVKSADEALALLQRASSVRSTRSVPLLCSVGGKQQQQYLSSRSHVVVTLYVESKVDLTSEDSYNPLATLPESSSKRTKKTSPDPMSSPAPSTCRQQLRLGRIQIVDLAGASAPTSSQNSMDSFIKRSLHTLGEVITGLSSAVTAPAGTHGGGKHSRKPSSGSASVGTSPTRVPYLDSKLTYLLKDSFGGLSKTAMLFHLSPLVQDYQVTLPTLQLALKAAQIRNNIRPVRLLATPEEIMDLKFDSFLISKLKAQFMSAYEADILTSRSFTRKLSLPPSSKKQSKYPFHPHFNASNTQSPYQYTQDSDFKGDKQSEQPTASTSTSLLISLTPPPPPRANVLTFSPDTAQKSLTLSERMRAKLGDDYALALEEPGPSAASLAALDHTVSAARSLRQELQGELEHMDVMDTLHDGTSAEMELSVIAECEQESRRCSRVALTSDLQELDLVSRLAKKLRSTLQQLQQQQQLTEDMKVDSSASPDIGVSPREVLLNGDDFIDDDFDILDMSATEIQPNRDLQVDTKLDSDHQGQQQGTETFETEGDEDDASAGKNNHDFYYDNLNNNNNEQQNDNGDSWRDDCSDNDVSAVLRQRVDELRETLNLLQQNQAVALEGCLEQLLQATAAASSSKETSGKRKQKNKQKQQGRSKKRATDQPANSDTESDTSSSDSASGSRGDKNSSLTPMSIRSVAVAFDDAYNNNRNDEEQYMRNPLLTAKAVSNNVTPQPHSMLLTCTPAQSHNKLRTSRANSYDRLDIALRENKILRNQIDQYNNTAADDSDVGTRNETPFNSIHNINNNSNINNNNNNNNNNIHLSSSTSPSLETANTMNMLAANADSNTALTALTTLLKSERSQLSEAQIQLQRSQIDLALARQECEHNSKTIVSLQEDISALREELRRTDTLHGQLVEQLRSATKTAVSKSDEEVIDTVRSDLFSSPVGSGFPAAPSTPAAQPVGGLILDSVEVKSPFSLISAVYSTLHLRPFFRESNKSPEKELCQGSDPNPPADSQVFTIPSREWDFHPIEKVPSIEIAPCVSERKQDGEKIELLEKSLTELRQVSAGYEEQLSAVKSELQQAKIDLGQSRAEAKEEIANMVAQLKRTNEELSSQQQQGTSPKPSPAAAGSAPRQQLSPLKKAEATDQAQSEELANLIHENQQLKYEVAFQTKLVANANRNVSDLLTLLSEKNDELQILRTTHANLTASISKSGSPTDRAVQPELVFAHPQINPNPGHITSSAQRDKEKTRSRNRALALVNSSGQGAFPSRGLPAPLTSQTETETELERPISPLTEDSFSIRDPDELALEQGLRLSLQLQTQKASHPLQHPHPLYAHGHHPRQQLSLEQEQQAVQRVLVFEDDREHPLQRQHKVSQSHGSGEQFHLFRQEQIPTQGTLTYPESSNMDSSLPTGYNRNNVMGSPTRRVDLPHSSQEMAGSESGEKRSPQQDAEIRQIMNRGYSYELAAEIYFKMKSRSTLQSSEKVKK